jgi:structure-specific recognition protein 1
MRRVGLSRQSALSSLGKIELGRNSILNPSFANCLTRNYSSPLIRKLSSLTLLLLSDRPPSNHGYVSTLPPYLKSLFIVDLISNFANHFDHSFAQIMPPDPSNGLKHRETFDNVYFDLTKGSGRCRFADSGIGWKSSNSGKTWTLDRSDIIQAVWSRAAKGYELKVVTNHTPSVVQLDGFQLEDGEKISKIFKNWFSVPFEAKEHSLRGWNWGKVEFGKEELAFNVQNRSAFEIPYSEIENTNLAGKNEVAIEFSLDKTPATEANGEKPRVMRGDKAASGLEELVEMRFYVPGTVVRDKTTDDDEEVVDDEGMVQEDAAAGFYNTILDKAQIGDVAGTTFASFPEVLHLTPRGRFDIDLYESSFRLRGKTYDYKIEFDHVKKFMLLPKPDDMHILICCGLEPPLRQGQTRYPFLVMQFKRDEEVVLDMNMTQEQLDSEKYKGRLQKSYEAPVANVVAQVFRGLAGKKIITPSKDFASVHRQSALKCSVKANEGHLFILDKSFLFVPKPATYISYDQIANVTFSRVGGALAASRTFDVTIKLKDGRGEHQFSNVNREEQGGLEDFLKLKNIKVKNEMMEDVSPQSVSICTLPLSYNFLFGFDLLANLLFRLVIS